LLYQAKLPPVKDGVQKPFKSGGYSDSGADIAYELVKNDIEIITPVENPDPKNDFDWVFPDTKQGIQQALDKGATILWLNTVLYQDHAITHFFNEYIQIIGQVPKMVDLFDDKLYTNSLLNQNQIPIPKTQQLHKKDVASYSLDIDFPMVVKPLRGRGSQGVFLVKSKNELDKRLQELYSKKIYGNAVYVETYLSGQEITITVMPPGHYTIDDRTKMFEEPWCLPAVQRFNHQNGIAPYSGVVAVLENSAVLKDTDLNSKSIATVNAFCIKAAKLLDIKAPIRIDCRADEHGKYYLFDINLKPNMTGPSRAHRSNQDSLTLLAARKIGWTYSDLLKNMISQRWKGNHSLK
ncbi:MAG: ATP-grasp domain-containing protein, partial [Flavobacteriaceae bacterium]|nr:ATP-grasp domain-containing protein [Flavobacteriaceae bacterium]